MGRTVEDVTRVLRVSREGRSVYPRIVQLAKQYGLSATEVARRLDMSQSGVLHLYKGEAVPTLETAFRVVLAFGGELDFIDLMPPDKRKDLRQYLYRMTR